MYNGNHHLLRDLMQIPNEFSNMHLKTENSKIMQQLSLSGE